jgi:hypothetical protein
MPTLKSGFHGAQVVMVGKLGVLSLINVREVSIMIWIANVNFFKEIEDEYL